MIINYGLLVRRLLATVIAGILIFTFKVGVPPKMIQLPVTRNRNSIPVR